jgi:hypothetical protein
VNCIVRTFIIFTAYQILLLGWNWEDEMGGTCDKWEMYAGSPSSSYTSIPHRTSPWFMFSWWNSSWFLISKLHRTYISLSILFSSQCLYGKNLYQKLCTFLT